MSTDARPTVPAEDRVAFRRLRADDLFLLQRWLTDPDVAAWYRSGDLTIPALAARYAGRITGADTTRAYIIEIDRQSAGYIQCYLLADEPEYARQLALPPVPPPGAAGTDLFLGDPAFRNHGWGTPVLRALHRRIVFGEMKATLAIIAPEPANRRAIRVYERVGFRWLKTVSVVDDECPENTGDEYVMTMTPAEFHARNPIC
ncbi:MAG TPA: GNAT family N-acetyltransferase [Thermomicrobiales bacterium]|nr:GNAT family N-acetyltransferase [Thermomicrobiales bacterium]